MRFRIPGIPVLSCIIFVLGCDSQSNDAGSESNDWLIETLTTLASDDHRGRGSLTPDAERAAFFLADQFESIGLATIPGENDFLQEFEVHKLATSASASINGIQIHEESMAVQGSPGGASWSSSSDVNTLSAGPDDDAGAMFGVAYESGEDFLMLVHESHESIFRSIKEYLEYPVTGFDQIDRANILVVLASDPSLENLNIHIQVEEKAITLYNVVGMIPGNRSDEFILFGGHYDHLGIIEPVADDSIANGANDNASGVAAVVELAYRLSAGTRPERSIMFSAFAAEEVGGFGSTYFSNHIDPDEIVAMFNLEMLGKTTTEGPRSAFITGWDRSDFGPLLQEAVEGENFLFFPDPYPDQDLFYRSDNATLARLGVPAHTISITRIDVDPDYHKVTDEISTLNVETVEQAVDAIEIGARVFISGDATPTRVLPE